jgi:hypothetical protein
MAKVRFNMITDRSWSACLLITACQIAPLCLNMSSVIISNSYHSIAKGARDE